MINEPVFLMSKSKDDIMGYGINEDDLFSDISKYMSLEDYVIVKVSDVIDPDLPLLNKAQKLVELGKISVSDAVEYIPASDTYAVTVEWGDWKHDHARLQTLFCGILGLYQVSEYVTEEDSEDCYSSIHKFSTYC